MTADQSAPSLDGLLGADSQDVEALEMLEARVLDMVEQLKEARSRQASAERDAAKLREEVNEKNKRIAELEARSAEGNSSRKAVRSRIESLLDRIESMEQN